MVRGGPTPAQGFPLPLLTLPHEEQPQNPSPCGIPTTQGTNPHRRAIGPAQGTPQAGPTPQGADSGNRQQAARRQTLITPQLKPPLNAAPTPASQPAAGQRRAPQPPRASPGGGGGSAQGPLRSERAPAGTQRPGTNVPRPKRSAPSLRPAAFGGVLAARGAHTHAHTHTQGRARGSQRGRDVAAPHRAVPWWHGGLGTAPGRAGRHAAGLCGHVEVRGRDGGTGLRGAQHGPMASRSPSRWGDGGPPTPSCVSTAWPNAAQPGMAGWERCGDGCVVRGCPTAWPSQHSSPGHGWLSIARIAPSCTAPSSRRGSLPSAKINRCVDQPLRSSFGARLPLRCTAPSPLHSSMSIAERCPHAQLPPARFLLHSSPVYRFQLHSSPLHSFLLRDAFHLAQLPGGLFLIAQLHFARLPSHCTAPFPSHSSLTHSSPAQQRCWRNPAMQPQPPPSRCPPAHQQGWQPPFPSVTLQLHPLCSTPPCHLPSPSCTCHLSPASLAPWPLHSAGINPPGSRRVGPDGTGVLLVLTPLGGVGMGCAAWGQTCDSAGQDAALSLRFVSRRGGDMASCPHAQQMSALCCSIPRHLLATGHLDPRSTGDDAQPPLFWPPQPSPESWECPCPHAALCPQMSHRGSRPPTLPLWLGLSRTPRTVGSALH